MAAKAVFNAVAPGKILTGKPPRPMRMSCWLPRATPWPPWPAADVAGAVCWPATKPAINGETMVDGGWIGR